MFYLFHAFIAALVLSVQAAVMVAGASMFLLVTLGVSERAGWLTHHQLGVGMFDLFGIEPLGLWLLLFAYATTLAFSIYFVATVLSQLREQERELVRLGRHLALSEKLASVGTLAAGVSHEINNPIGVIKGPDPRYRVQDGDDQTQLLAELDVVDKHTRRIAQITDGLLQFSRETPFAMQRLDVPSLLREAEDLVRVPFRQAEVELGVATSLPERTVVSGSSNHLLQVLINILLNAKDASRAGDRVDVSAEVRGREVAVEIRDRGQGIEAELLEKIFDPFFTTKDVDKGTAWARDQPRIVERHEGRIEVKSERGRGTCFSILLPASQSDS